MNHNEMESSHYWGLAINSKKNRWSIISKNMGDEIEFAAFKIDDKTKTKTLQRKKDAFKSVKPGEKILVFEDGSAVCICEITKKLTDEHIYFKKIQNFSEPLKKRECDKKLLKNVPPQGTTLKELPLEDWKEFMRLIQKRNGDVELGDSSKDAANTNFSPEPKGNNKPFPRNLIYFGAPGTGKSYKLKVAVEGETDKDGNIVKDKDKGIFIEAKGKEILKRRYERVTFYPTYSYAQFVGCYKPVMEETGNARKTEILSPEQLTEELKKSLALAEKNAQSESDSGKGKIVSILLFGEKYFASLGKLTPSDRLKILRDGGAKTKADPVYFGHGITMGKVNSEGNEEITNSTIAYKFVPGPFLRILVRALNDTAHNYCLVIEEINRANAAAVFGDVFQLLDRPDGISEYDVAVSKDVKKFLYEDKDGLTEDGKKTLEKLAGEGRLKIPSNMYIWATMNSADQGVFPLDTAFKRRWEFEYIDINNGEKDHDDKKKAPEEWTIEGKKYEWNMVRKFINGLLSLHGVNEDKLMGARFVTASGKIVAAKSFESKVLMYLWEDAGRMCRKEMFGNDILTYSTLVNKWKDNGIVVFSKDTKLDSLGDDLKTWYGNSVNKEEKSSPPSKGTIGK